MDPAADRGPVAPDPIQVVQGWAVVSQHRSGDDGVITQPPLFAVADGIDDGNSTGQQALDEVVGVIHRRRPTPRHLRAVLHAANWTLWSKGDTAATMTLVLIGREQVVVAHVGDSRAYLLRDNRSRLLTNDHFDGSDPEPGRATRLGREPTPARLDITRIDLLAGDRLLLCTDGMWKQFERGAPPPLTSCPISSAEEILHRICAYRPIGDATAVIIDPSVLELERPR